MSYILIIGAKSDIAKEVARVYAKHGYNLYLGARQAEQLNDFVQDLKVRYKIEALNLELDLLNFEIHNSFYSNIKENIYGVICVAGYMPDQKLAEKDFFETQKIINTNYTGAVSLLNIISNDFEFRKEGFIIGVSSVAGDRGRKSNYLYGSSKAAFTAYLSGLRNRLSESNVQVITVKPGFVQTKLTENMDLPERLTAQPNEVAEDIYQGHQKGKNIIYTKWFWRYIMLIIKCIPEFIFKKMSI